MQTVSAYYSVVYNVIAVGNECKPS